MSPKKLVLGVFLCALLSGCARERAPRIVFPLDGATFANPVTLEADQPVTWLAGGEVLGEGAVWRGQLPAGEHRVEAVSRAGRASLSLNVSDMFPVGEVRTLRADLTPKVRLPEGDFLLILGNPTSEALELSPQTTLQSAPQSSASSLDARLRLAERDLAGRAQPLEPALSAQSLPEVGEIRTFTMLDPSGLGSDEVSATLHAVGPHSLVYVEDPDTVNLTLVDQVHAAYEGHIRERVVTLFGQHSDVDGNGRVILLFSERLNRSQRAVGFFYGGDLFARDETNLESNEAEILYLGVPDPKDLNFSVNALAATSAHELQHLVNLSRKTLPRIGDATPPVESVAINEGLSHLAEDLCGYNVSGGNLAFAARFLERPHEVSLSGTDVRGWGDSAERRGAAYLFLRYAFEQAGAVTFAESGAIEGGGVSFLNDIVDSGFVGVEGVARASRTDSPRLLWSWWWALWNDEGLALPGYAERTVDPATGEFQGVDPYVGEVHLAPDFTVTLQGPQMVEAWTASLPENSASYTYISGGQEVALPKGTSVQVLRTR